MIGRKLSFVPSPISGAWRVPKTEPMPDIGAQTKFLNQVPKVPTMRSNLNDAKSTGHILSKVSL